MSLKDVEIDGKKIYLKKRMFGYKIVYPIRNEDGSINWINLLFGGWGNLVKLLFYIGFAVLLYFGIHQLMGNCQYIAANPCEFCYNMAVG